MLRHIHNEAANYDVIWDGRVHHETVTIGKWPKVPLPKQPNVRKIPKKQNGLR